MPSEKIALVLVGADVNQWRYYVRFRFFLSKPTFKGTLHTCRWNKSYLNILARQAIDMDGYFTSSPGSFPLSLRISQSLFPIPFLTLPSNDNIVSVAMGESVNLSTIYEQVLIVPGSRFLKLGWGNCMSSPPTRTSWHFCVRFRTRNSLNDVCCLLRLGVRGGLAVIPFTF